MSNTERQRRFRERNPGYYGRLHAKRRAAYAVPVQQAQLTAVAISAPAQPLLLPAPVEQDLLLQQIAAAAMARQAEIVSV